MVFIDSFRYYDVASAELTKLRQDHPANRYILIGFEYLNRYEIYRLYRCECPETARLWLES